MDSIGAEILLMLSAEHKNQIVNRCDMTCGTNGTIISRMK